MDQTRFLELLNKAERTAEEESDLIAELKRQAEVQQQQLAPQQPSDPVQAEQPVTPQVEGADFAPAEPVAVAPDEVASPEEEKLPEPTPAPEPTGGELPVTEDVPQSEEAPVQDTVQDVVQGETPMSLEDFTGECEGALEFLSKYAQEKPEDMNVKIARQSLEITLISLKKALGQ